MAKKKTIDSDVLSRIEIMLEEQVSLLEDRLSRGALDEKDIAQLSDITNILIKIEDRKPKKLKKPRGYNMSNDDLKRYA